MYKLYSFERSGSYTRDWSVYKTVRLLSYV